MKTTVLAIASIGEAATGLILLVYPPILVVAPGFKIMTTTANPFQAGSWEKTAIG